MRRLKVLHVLPSLVVEKNEMGDGGGIETEKVWEAVEWKGQSLITLAPLGLLRKQTNLSHLSRVYMAGK